MGATAVPHFPQKLYGIVDDPATNHIISWDNDVGPTFTIHDEWALASEVCPRYFKHNKYQSFVRQLNAYGFKKRDSDQRKFGHEKFIKGRRDLLEQIETKKKTQGKVVTNGTTEKAIVEIGKYRLMDELRELKRDKDQLVKELIVTRQQEQLLKSRCESLERKVDNLEMSSAQIQNFILNYFSHALSPHHAPTMNERKRKRLPSADKRKEDSENPEHLPVAVIPRGPSLDMLRQMLHQIQLSSDDLRASRENVTATQQTTPAANAHPQPSYAPPTIQEIREMTPTASTASMSSIIAKKDGDAASSHNSSNSSLGSIYIDDDSSQNIVADSKSQIVDGTLAKEEPLIEGAVPNGDVSEAQNVTTGSNVENLTPKENDPRKMEITFENLDNKGIGSISDIEMSDVGSPLRNAGKEEPSITETLELPVPSESWDDFPPLTDEADLGFIVERLDALPDQMSVNGTT